MQCVGLHARSYARRAGFMVCFEESACCENIKGQSDPGGRGGLRGLQGGPNSDSSEAGWHGASGSLRESKQVKGLEGRRGHLSHRSLGSSCTPRLKRAHSAQGGLAHMNITFWKQMPVQKWFSWVNNRTLTGLQDKEVNCW